MYLSADKVDSDPPPSQCHVPTCFRRGWSTLSSLSSEADSTGLDEAATAVAVAAAVTMKFTLGKRLAANGCVDENASHWLRFRPSIPRPKKWSPRWKGQSVTHIIVAIFTRPFSEISGRFEMISLRKDYQLLF